MTARRSVWALGFSLGAATLGAMGAAFLGAAGCSSSSSPPSSNNTGEDGGGQANDSGGTTQGDATVANLDGGSKDSGNGSSPHDGGSSPDAAAINAASAGDAGAASFCAALTTGLLGCCDAGADAGPCMAQSCQPGSAAMQRVDYVQALSTCVETSIPTHCSNPQQAISQCQLTTTQALTDTPAVTSFCKSFELSFCPITDCRAEVGAYSDPTISSLSTCLPDLPDSGVDGGCSKVITCLGNILGP
jgi:hypothetical protein